MKVTILSFYSGLIDRGVETWAKSVKEKLGEKFDIRIIGGEEYGEKIDWENKNKFYWRFLVLRHAVSSLKKWAMADVVIATNGTFQSLFCRIITLLARKPLLIFGHSGLGADDKWNLLCSPNVFVAFSNAQAQWARGHKLPWTKVVVIPHAVDTNRFVPTTKKPRKKVVLCVAANQPNKRVGLVMKAVERLDGFLFFAVGKGNEAEASFDNMPKVYQDADVFCFTPQPWEAFGLVFLEAMASNLPVVTVDDPIRREIVGDAGIFVKDPEDTENLAKAIKMAYDKDWGQKPRKQAEKFSWDKTTKEYKKLFDSMI